MKKVIILLLFPLFVSAQEISIESDYSRDAELNTYNQYYWMMDNVLGDNLWVNLNTLKSALIRDAIEYQMDLLDYHKNVDNPDILVNYYIFSEGLDQEPFDDFDGDEGEFPNINLDAITDGTLIISFIDINTKETVWLGYAKDVVNEQNKDNLRQQQKSIRKAVARLMSTYQDAVNNP